MLVGRCARSAPACRVDVCLVVSTTGTLDGFSSEAEGFFPRTRTAQSAARPLPVRRASCPTTRLHRTHSHVEGFKQGEEVEGDALVAGVGPRRRPSAGDGPARVEPSRSRSSPCSRGRSVRQERGADDVRETILSGASRRRRDVESLQTPRGCLLGEPAPANRRRRRARQGVPRGTLADSNEQSAMKITVQREATYRRLHNTPEALLKRRRARTHRSARCRERSVADPGPGRGNGSPFAFYGSEGGVVARSSAQRAAGIRQAPTGGNPSERLSAHTFSL